MNWFLVVGENSHVSPQAHRSREVADAFCQVKAFDYPHSGPWKVVHVAEVREAVPVNQDNDE